ncbi:hypothetical protein OE88DRAFT_1651733 [Heliocybe sulcata]|uniref:SWR1-complex protein 4 n=1 Tax=Heliocybe sulcata TaxID=5364 RepID=A0A5C3NDM2_9AGAM|nr:hypothetical protein OE88DRAFT_1651733 [Heliocybe sulcata]
MSGASAADVRSILSLPPSGPQSNPSHPPPPLKKAGSGRKPEGISRELYALIGPTVPSLLQSSKPRLKQKPNLGGGSRRVKWEHRNFKNPARKDSLQLQHWAKADDPEDDYVFAKYNVESNIYTYSQDEYNRLLEDSEWTKEETDYLFNIVREYDLRWFVIHDRYEFSGGPERSLEDLKDRYYSVCRKLVRSRPWPGDEASKSQLLNSLQFDKEREVTRKKYLTSLASRTPAQIAEEEALFIEIKRLEQTERRFKKDREELLRTLAGVESGLEGVFVDDDGPMGVSESKKKKKHGGDWESASAASNVISLGTPVPKKGQQSTKASVPSPEEDILHCIHRTSALVPNNLPATKNAHTPVYLRSAKIPVPKPAGLAPKVTAALAELGINHQRLVMPTKENCEKLESLLDAAAALVDLKRAVDRVEQEIKTSRERMDKSKSTSASVAGDAPETPMDLDQDETGTERDAEGEKEDESVRAQSVVSTRSTRGRKSSRRSMSISSVDTSTPVATRATKRMKK